ncbi:MAG: hypothetical protein J6Q68_01830 [Clostridia bacterium]|nr:hypothetical protein [Clostridia bacterium]
MKRISKYIIVLTSTLLLFISGLTVIYAQDAGIETTDISDEEKNEIIENIGISFVEEHPSKTTMSCFDVNGSGMVAIGHSKFIFRGISVFDKNGEFLFGYKFV